MSHEGKHPSNLSPSPDGLPPCPTFVRKPGAPFPPEVRDYALLLVASGMKRADVARRIGGTEETLGLWVNAARETGTMPAAPQAASAAEESDPPSPAVPQRAPVDPGQGLGAHEQAGILEIKSGIPPAPRRSAPSSSASRVRIRMADLGPRDRPGAEAARLRVRPHRRAAERRGSRE